MRRIELSAKGTAKRGFVRFMLDGGMNTMTRFHVRFRIAAASSFVVPVSLLDRLVDDPVDVVRERAAENTRLSPQTMMRLALSSDDKRLMIVAGNSAITSEVAEVIAMSELRTSRVRLASNKSTPDEVRRLLLLLDSSRAVRKTAVSCFLREQEYLRFDNRW